MSREEAEKIAVFVMGVRHGVEWADFHISTLKKEIADAIQNTWKNGWAAGIAHEQTERAKTDDR